MRNKAIKSKNQFIQLYDYANSLYSTLHKRHLLLGNMVKHKYTEKNIVNPAKYRSETTREEWNVGSYLAFYKSIKNNRFYSKTHKNSTYQV